MKTREKSFIRIAFVIFLTMIVSESSAFGAQSDPASGIIEGAKKEGALVLK